MAASISILGNTGSDAELRYSEQGLPIASFSMASNSFKNTREGRVQVTEWYNVTAFGKVAETLGAHVKKGTQLLVLGRLTFKPWLTKNGEPRAGAEVVLQSFEFAGGNRNNGAEGSVDAAVEEPQDIDQINKQLAATNGEAVVAAGAAGVEPYVDQF
jgi:single-strand DNA-binding protein